LVEVVADDAVRGLVGVGDVAGQLPVRDAVREMGQGRGRVVAELEKSMVRAFKRGGVPVLRRPTSNPRRLRSSGSSLDGASPLRPAGKVLRPMWMRPFRKVPVVRMTARPA